MQTTVADPRTLNRLIDSHASSEAAAALHRAAAHDRTAVLSSADAVLRDPDNPAAFDRLRNAAESQEFRSLLPKWTKELREIASLFPDSGGCTVATALRLWSWTGNHLRGNGDDAGAELAEALAPLLAARCFVLEVAGQETTPLRSDLAHVYSAHVSALAATTCAELVFGYRKHLLWDAEGCATCYVADDLDELEAFMPGIAAGARTNIDVIEADGSHPAKRGPCANFNGLETFMRLRNRLDACLTGARFAKQRAAEAIAR